MYHDPYNTPGINGWNQKSMSGREIPDCNYSTEKKVNNEVNYSQTKCDLRSL